jgi:hypothetical protein
MNGDHPATHEPDPQKPPAPPPPPDTGREPLGPAMPPKPDAGETDPTKIKTEVQETERTGTISDAGDPIEVTPDPHLLGED